MLFPRVLCLLGVAALLSPAPAFASPAPPPFFLALNGPLEMVYNYADTCGYTPGGSPIDADDSMPIAWRRADGKTVLVSAAGHGIHGLVGDSLDSLTHICDRAVFNGTFDPTPQSFANYQVGAADVESLWAARARLSARAGRGGDRAMVRPVAVCVCPSHGTCETHAGQTRLARWETRGCSRRFLPRPLPLPRPPLPHLSADPHPPTPPTQWLQSVLSFPNGSFVGLAHNEFHGDHEGEPYCSGRSSSHCEVWSTGLAVSHDGGASFQLAAKPPDHLVAAMPYTYEKDQRTSGYGAVSAMLPGDDGAFYGMINVLGLKDQQPGNCPFRTTNVFDRHAYRAWNGSHFSVPWADPYTSAAGGLCQPLPLYDAGSHPSLRRLVGLPDHWPSFLHLNVDGHLGENGQCGYAFSEQRDFAGAITSWDSYNRTLDLGVDRFLTLYGHVQYTSLLDVSSPNMGVYAAGGDARGTVEGNSYALFGNRTGYIYFVADRSIMRRRVVFTQQAPPPPPPPLPPAPQGCAAFNVTGAGLDDVNGRYVKSNVTSEGLPVYRKDAAHQLYRYNGVWKLAQEYNSSSVHYIAKTVNTTLPSPEGWRLFLLSSVPPAPEAVVCDAPPPL